MKTIAIFLAGILLCVGTNAEAGEKGLVLRAGDLLAQPFIDAAKTGPLTANQAVTIVERRGAWASIEADGKKGWVRLLNLRLAPGAPGVARPGARPSSNPVSFLQTGSTGRTVTTGVKGMDEEDIKNATPNYAELEILNSLGVKPEEAKLTAQTAKLKENKVDYLAKGKARKEDKAK